MEKVRAATAADVPAIVGLVRDLAEYERSLDQVELTADDLTAALFGPSPAVYAHVAVDGSEVVGFAVWFLNYSTWTGRHGIYLEDLYVRPERRGGGYGRALLAALARLCVERGYRRFEWSVLDWNTPAIGFYRSLGATAQDEWTVQRLAGKPLEALGSPVSGGRSRLGGEPGRRHPAG